MKEENNFLSNAEWTILGINIIGAFLIILSVVSAIVFLIILDVELKSSSATVRLTEVKGNIIYYDEVLTGTGLLYFPLTIFTSQTRSSKK
jgi:hypothetical protein